MAGLPSDHFVSLFIGTSIKIRLEALWPGSPVSPRWVGAVTGHRGYVGLLAFWIFTLAETRWWHLKQVDDGVPVQRDWSKQHGLSEHIAQQKTWHRMRNTGCDRRRCCVIPKTAGSSRRREQPAYAYSDLCAVRSCLLTKTSQFLSRMLVGVHCVCMNGVSASDRLFIISVWGHGRGDSSFRPAMPSRL